MTRDANSAAKAGPKSEKGIRNRLIGLVIILLLTVGAAVIATQAPVQKWVSTTLTPGTKSVTSPDGGALALAAPSTACTNPAAPDPDQPRLALVIAQTTYTNGPTPVASAEGEADLIENALCQVGFHTVRHRDLNKVELKTALDDFRVSVDAAGSNTIAFVYYTGHGAQNPNTRESYLLGTETRLRTASDITAYGIDLRSVSSELSATSARAIILVFDACRNIAVPGAKGNIKGLGRVDPDPGVLIAYSTDLNHVAQEGLYAPELAAEIVQPGQDVIAMFAKVGYRVAQRSAELGAACTDPELCGPQRPYMEPRIYEGIFLKDGPALPFSASTGVSSGPGLPKEIEDEFNLDDILLSDADSSLLLKAYGESVTAKVVAEEAKTVESLGRAAAYRFQNTKVGCASGVFSGECDNEQGVRHGVEIYGGASEGESFAGRIEFGSRALGHFRSPDRPGEPKVVADYFGQFGVGNSNERGTWSGHGTVTYQDDSQYAGEVRAGQKQGFGECTLPDGSVIYARWQRDVRMETFARNAAGDKIDPVSPVCGSD